MNDNAVRTRDLIDEVADLLATGRLNDAMAVAEKGVGEAATQVDATCALAAIAFRSRQLANAIQLLELTLDHSVPSSDIPELLAVLNCLAGRLSDALFYAKLSTTVRPEGRLRALFGPTLPSFADAFRSVGEKPLMRQARAMIERHAYPEAINRLEQHLELFANDVTALDLYAEALIATGMVRKAIGILRTVLTLAGPSATLLSRLGNCLTEIGELDDALACHREAVSRAPKAIALHAALLRDWAANPHAEGRGFSSAVENWRQAMQAAMPKTVRKPPAAMVKDELCVGYLCAGSLDADTKAMLRRIVLAHDRTRIKVLGFGNGSLDSPGNIAFRGAFDNWRDVSSLDELTLAALIRGEGTDVIVNVDGLMGPGHLGVFMRNCAPVQLSWLNLPEGIELPGAHGSLASAGLAAGPLLLQAAAAQASPSNTDRPVFGADCTLAELNAEVARVWSAILHATPNATLTLLGRGLDEPEAVNRLIERFGNFGVAHRIDINSADSHQSFFATIDVALAPFPMVRPAPYGIALSMGVPVVGLPAGDARLLCDAVKATGAEGGLMVAGSPADYVAKAVNLAQTPALRAGLAGTRNAANYSEQAFAAALESFFREALASRAAEQQ